MQGIIVERDGRKFVQYDSPRNSEPKIQRMCWAIERVTAEPFSAERPAPGDVARHVGNGEWHTSRDGRPRTGSVNTGRGDKQAEHVEVLDAPRPKVRSNVELRWLYGRWEKLSKREGWVPA